MSRRSSRLVSGGYYNSDEESDSSSVTNISYRENPVKVFKKKAGNRKAGSRASSRANSNASLSSPESPSAAGVSPLAISQKPSAIRTTPHVFPTATPRPALTPSLTPSSSRSQTPTRCCSVPPERSPYAGLYSSIRPEPKQPSHSGVDSSGYSSSEGPYRRPTAPSSSSSTSPSTNPEASSAGYRSRISSSLSRLTDSASCVAAAAHSKVVHLTHLANASMSSRTKKALGLLLLLLLILLCIWLILPLLTSFISRMTFTKTSLQTKPKSPPVTPATPPPQPSPLHSAPVVDPAVVSAAVEAKMQHLLAELQLKQEQLLFQMKERVQLDLHSMNAKLEAVQSDSRVRLEQEAAGLGRQLAEHQTQSHTAQSSLSLRVQALEAQNAKLSQELLSIQLQPPPTLHPDSSAITNSHITPELQQAMEKWFTDRIKEHDAVRLADKGGCSDCGRPVADKMADFALETQGASVISTRCSETYRIRSACVTLFGFPLWYPSESPRTVIQGFPVLLPGKCWAFHGVQGTLVIALSHPVRITHVTLDHLPRYNSPTGRIDSAPKDFEVYGMKNDTEEGTLLGTFTYDENGESTQTFKLPNPTDEVYRYVELRVLNNWGHIEYTCLYRFRVHGKMAST
ncbi:uncharacterized protein sun2 [Betta splendens]|uniref:Uncharacterized protein sun2 n=1 Tax=Betta splendens TaxID=158456 RepID=A0A6P7N939_BETSP|nr:uncharacterized protein sun2 [Betta splendens]XP_040927829.1 uncharacterized protein sun2 [Betta splendens]